VAFLKFSRDKRGYENFYLMQPSIRGKSRPRLLYWFHTPPNVKVGRTPFDPDVRRALEAQNPDVSFDWTAITQTPIPPADTERWRERRRVERAIRTADAETIDEAEAAQEAAIERPVEAQAPLIVETTAEPLPIPPAEPEPVAAADSESASKLAVPAPEAAAGTAGRRRRRRRRGRRKGQSSDSNVRGSNVPGSALEVSDAASNGTATAESEAARNDSEAADDEDLEP